MVQIVRPIVRTVGGVPQRVRDLGRLREVAQVLVRHGYGIVVAELNIPGLPRPASTELEESTPEAIVAMLRDLGPTFVKLGQVLSTRPDLVPEAYVHALRSLQDDVGPISEDAVFQALSSELGEDWRAQLASFDDKPLATASIAQVHAAVLPDGTEVVFKLRRPGIARKIQSDLHILRVLANSVSHVFPETDSLDLDGILDEFERSILAELDFRKEARNQERAAQNFADNAHVRVPAVIARLSTSRVLCMERLNGVKISEARAAGHDMSVVGDRYLEAAYEMLFVHGLFHGDLHPGNVMVLPGDVIGLLDFGMMGHMTPQMQSDIMFTLFALQRGDYRSLARVMYEIGIKTRHVDYAALERDTVMMVDKHWGGRSLRDLQIGPFIVDLMRKATEHGARIPPDYTMFFKAIVTTEGLAKSIIEEVDPIAAARPYIERLMRERFDTSQLSREALYHGLALSSIARRLPMALTQLLDDLDGERFGIGLRVSYEPAVEQAKDARLARALHGAGAIASMLCVAMILGHEPVWWHGIPLITTGFAGLALLLAWRARE